MITQNKKAQFAYEIIDKLDAGIVLTGAEVKSLRAGKVSINEAYCFFKKEALYIRSMYVAPYDKASHTDDPYRERKLLLKKPELLRWKKRSTTRGLSLVPLRVFFSTRGWAKVSIALARGKKLHDKRESIKEKEVKRKLGRLVREKISQK